MRSLLAVASLLPLVHAACPNGGISKHNRCWYLSKEGTTCKATCAAQGLDYSHMVAGEASPMVPLLLGRTPAHKQFPWGRIECYVASADRYHTAKEKPDSSTGDNGEPGDWGLDVCRLSCACSNPAASGPMVYPSCTQSNVVLRHAGAHAIFVDLSTFGSVGCWQNDCKHSDKFNAEDPGVCARACSHIEECTHWSFGSQDGATKCFFRKSDGGREDFEGFVSGPKACSPPQLPDAFQAFAAGELLRICDEGKSDACPNVEHGANTWKFAIRHLQKATEGRLDAGTIQYVNQIAADTDAFLAQISEENFPVVVANNRQVFNALYSWMQSQPKASIDPADKSLPAPLRGSLCGSKSCYQ